MCAGSLEAPRLDYPVKVSCLVVDWTVCCTKKSNMDSLSHKIEHVITMFNSKSTAFSGQCDHGRISKTNSGPHSSTLQTATDEDRCNLVCEQEILSHFTMGQSVLFWFLLTVTFHWCVLVVLDLTCPSTTTVVVGHHIHSTSISTLTLWMVWLNTRGNALTRPLTALMLKWTMSNLVPGCRTLWTNQLMSSPMSLTLTLSRRWIDASWPTKWPPHQPMRTQWLKSVRSAVSSFSVDVIGLTLKPNSIARRQTPPFTISVKPPSPEEFPLFRCQVWTQEKPWRCSSLRQPPF